MMKKVKHWFKYLPLDIRELAIANVSPERLEEFAYSLDDALSSFFVWEDTPKDQGFEFWNNICNRAANGDFDFRVDEIGLLTKDSISHLINNLFGMVDGEKNISGQFLDTYEIQYSMVSGPIRVDSIFIKHLQTEKVFTISKVGENFYCYYGKPLSGIEIANCDLIFMLTPDKFINGEDINGIMELWNFCRWVDGEN